MNLKFPTLFFNIQNSQRMVKVASTGVDRLAEKKIGVE